MQSGNHAPSFASDLGPALALTFTLTLTLILTRILILTVPGGISLPSTCHGFPARVFQVSLPAVHLARQFLSSWDVGAFQQDKLVVCSMKRVADVSRMVQLRVSHVWTHLQLRNRLTGAYRAHLSLQVCREMLHLEMITPCDYLIIKDFAIYVFCRCASALINTDA